MYMWIVLILSGVLVLGSQSFVSVALHYFILTIATIAFARHSVAAVVEIKKSKEDIAVCLISAAMFAAFTSVWFMYGAVCWGILCLLCIREMYREETA